MKSSPGCAKICVHGIHQNILACNEAAFELRKNKRLSHIQTGYKFWLSVQVFGFWYQFVSVWCAWSLIATFKFTFILFLWNIIISQIITRYKSEFWLQECYGCPSPNCISIFWLSGDLFSYPGQPKFRTLVWLAIRIL